MHILVSIIIKDLFSTCRNINYDEKDPYMCHVCGFSKYIKWDFSLLCKPTFLVDPVENEEEKQKLQEQIRGINEKCEKIYRHLAMGYRPQLEQMLLQNAPNHSTADHLPGGLDEEELLLFGNLNPVTSIAEQPTPTASAASGQQIGTYIPSFIIVTYI